MRELYYCLQSEVCCLKTEVSVKSSLLGCVTAQHDKLADTVSKLKELLRESRDSITQLPIVVEANAELTKERDQLAEELASARAEVREFLYNNVSCTCIFMSCASP